MSDPFPPGSRLVAYLRDSGGPDQELSVPQQEAAVRAWCAEHGYHLARIYADLARSGKSTAGREQFLEMTAYFRDGGGEQGVILWEYSRFARDYDDAMFYLAEMRRSGCVVHSLHDNIPAGLDGRLLESLIAWRNAKFLEDLSRNVRRGLAYTRAQHHAYQPHLPPAGYRKARRTIGSRRDGSAHTVSVLEPDPDTAPLVQLAFQMKAAGHSRDEIHAATHLFSAPSSYARMFRNAVYIGEYGGIADFCPPLVDRETFDAVRERVGGYIHPRRERSSYLLSGLAGCAACGRLLSGFTITSRGRRYRYYRCISAWRFGECRARMIPAGELEGQAIARLRAYLSDEAIMAAVVAEVEQLAGSLSAETQAGVARLERERESVTANITRLVAAVRAAGHSPALLADLAAQEARQAELETAIARERRQLSAKMERLPSGDEIRAAYDATLAELETASPRRVQLILRSFVVAVRAQKGAPGEIEFVTAAGGSVVWSL